VIVSLPTGSVVVEIVTVPAALTLPDPSVEPPLVNVTRPVTFVGNVAVIVTDAPYVLGPEVVTVIEGVAWLTTWVTVPLSELFAESPP
jgi:hypothetical protein